MLVLLVVQRFALGEELIQPGPPDSCFKINSVHKNEVYHKNVPSPEASDLPECQSWKELSCCTHALTETLSHSKTRGINNLTYDLCGTLSPRCGEYFRVRK